MESLIQRLRDENRDVAAVTAQFPVRLIKGVDALAKHTKQSRTRVMVELVKVGYDEACAELDDEARKALERAGVLPC